MTQITAGFLFERLEEWRRKAQFPHSEEVSGPVTDLGSVPPHQSKAQLGLQRAKTGLECKKCEIQTVLNRHELTTD